MKWNNILTTVITILIALVVWEMFVKNIVIRGEYESYLESENYDAVDELSNLHSSHMRVG